MDKFLANHPRLRTLGRRSQRARPSTTDSGTSMKPFAHPENWAAFVVLGA